MPLKMTSYFSQETMVSVLVPEEWEGQVLGEDHFRIFGPEEPDFDDYRPTLSFKRTDIAGDGPEWFEGVIATTGQDLARENNAFEQRGEERFTLSCAARVHARWYEWIDEETGLHFAQLQALILAADGRLLVLNAATLEPLRDTHWPVFEEILRSTRLIPEAPEGVMTGDMMRIAIAFFEDGDWAYHVNEEGDAIMTTFTGENGQCTCLANAIEEDDQFVFYSVCPVNAPEDKVFDVVELITRVNYHLLIGNFEIDVDEGEIRFRTSIDVEGDRFSTALLRQLVAANVAMMDAYLPEFMTIIYGDAPQGEEN